MSKAEPMEKPRPRRTQSRNLPISEEPTLDQEAEVFCAPRTEPGQGVKASGSLALIHCAEGSSRSEEAKGRAGYSGKGERLPPGGQSRTPAWGWEQTTHSGPLAPESPGWQGSLATPSARDRRRGETCPLPLGITSSHALTAGGLWAPEHINPHKGF